MVVAECENAPRVLEKQIFIRLRPTGLVPLFILPGNNVLKGFFERSGE
jgi:hypothetical protein